MHASWIAVASLLAWGTLCSADALAANEVASKPILNGIWSPTQGVIWDTDAHPGQEEHPPFTPEYAERYRRARAAAAAGKPLADPPAACLPPGIPRIMASPFPFEIIQTQNIVYVLFEYMSQVQRIFLNGTGPGALGMPTFNGYSEGRWDGDTLLVTTTELNPVSVLDTTHVETSDALRVEERLRLAAPDRLQVTFTLYDSKAFTNQWVTHRTYVRKQGERILPYVCEENNRNPVQPDGTTGLTVPAESH